MREHHNTLSAHNTTSTVEVPQDHDTPRCLLCGHAALPFDVRLSAMLDMLALMEALLHDLKREVEELAS
jgi:hypothetical protein